MVWRWEGVWCGVSRGVWCGVGRCGVVLYAGKYCQQFGRKFSARLRLRPTGAPTVLAFTFHHEHVYLQKLSYSEFKFVSSETCMLLLLQLLLLPELYTRVLSAF